METCLRDFSCQYSTDLQKLYKSLTNEGPVLLPACNREIGWGVHFKERSYVQLTAPIQLDTSWRYVVIYRIEYSVIVNTVHGKYRSPSLQYRNTKLHTVVYSPRQQPQQLQQQQKQQGYNNIIVFVFSEVKHCM